MNTKSQKEMAARILKCGVSRVRVKQSKEVEEALTRNDMRELIQKKMVTKVQKKGTTRARARKTLEQKNRGRRAGRGSRKGTLKARNPAKREWMTSVRALRKLLRELYDSKQVDQATYRKMYPRIKGGFFRNKKHLVNFLNEHELLKPRARAVKTDKPKESKPKTAKPKSTKPKTAKGDKK
jgi:large subunit ribosomal protein L19e